MSSSQDKGGLPATVRRTRPLDPPVSTGREITLIPATERRLSAPTQVPAAPRRRRPLVFLGTLLGCLIVLFCATILVSPLDSGPHGSGIMQTIGMFFSEQAVGVFDPSQRIPTPTPTLAVLTNEGYCGGSDIWGKCAYAVTDSGVMGTGDMQPPMVGSIITQVFANPEYQIWCGCIKPHSGIDLAAPYGTAVMAADSGQVIWTGWDWSGLGWAVKIAHGHYIATIYGHLARFIVKVGDNVEKGQTIAYEGSTGASTGPHLHFMVLVNNKWVNPLEYVALP